MSEFKPQPLYDFYLLPEVGPDNWDYAFATGQVRALETQLISRNTFVEMINSPDYKSAADVLTGTDYAFVSTTNNLEQVEQGLIDKRSDILKLFNQLIDNCDYLELYNSRIDFSNLRLALRRLVTEQAIGLDYCDDGCVPAGKFEEVLEQENYIEFPMFLQEAVEKAVLRYYENKDIRQIDYGIDQAADQFRVEKSESMGDIFPIELARMISDLNDIRTLLRLKFRDSQQRDCFSGFGYLDKAKLIHSLDIGYDGLPAVFANTPYYHIVEAGTAYLVKNSSFLKLEQLCNNHLLSYLKSTDRVTAGPQTVIAYLLTKEIEIRTIRMILVGKKSGLESKMLLDGIYSTEEYN